MAGTKRNHYLDAESEEEDEGNLSYDSEELKDSRHSKTSSLRLRTVKRRKVSQSGSDSDENVDSDEAQYIDHERTPAPKLAEKNKVTEQDLSESVRKGTTILRQDTERKLPREPKEKKRKRKTGVVYLSRIPPFMKPPTVRQLLSPYGTITRLFLTPEPQAHYLARKKNHGNKKRSFLDGWVEFGSKKHAKACAETINGELVGGKKGGWYHDDIWNAKYLKGFKWDDLMEGVRSEERAREERMRVEIRRETRERKAFLEGVEQSKKERGMEKKRAEKRQNRPPDVSESTPNVTSVLQKADSRKDPGDRQKRKYERRFKQKEVRTAATATADEQPDEVRRVLNKIF